MRETLETTWTLIKSKENKQKVKGNQVERDQIENNIWSNSKRIGHKANNKKWNRGNYLKQQESEWKDEEREKNNNKQYLC